MSKFRLSKRDVSKTVDADTVMGFSWPVAEDYEVVFDDSKGEVIRAVGGYKLADNKPLEDGGLFLNLAKAGSSQKRMMDWVRTYGLPRRDKGRGLGDPIPVHEFEAEAAEAYRALRLYEAVRGRDAAMLRPCIKRERIPLPADAEPDDRSPFANLYVDGTQIPSLTDAEGEISDEEVLSAGAYALVELVNAKLAAVRFKFAEYFPDHPRPLAAGYMPVLGWGIPDLLAAAWFQFAWIMSDSRPLRTCQYCGEQYALSRSDQKTCGKDRCRQMKSRQERAQRDEN